MPKTTVLLMLLGLCVFGRSDASAQQPKTHSVRSRTPVGIALLDNLPVPNQKFLVKRTPGAEPADLILLQKGASTSDLSDAIRALVTARQIGGDMPTKAATIRVRPGTGSPRKDLKWAERVMKDLEKAERKSIGGVGEGRMVVIFLPTEARSASGPSQQRSP